MSEDKYIHGYKFRIYPTDDQKKLISKYTNLYRYVYNWAMSKQNEQYDKKKKGETDDGFFSFFELCKLYAEHRDLPDHEWLKEFPNTTARLALRDVVNAFKDFFRRGYGHPKFKSKKRSPKMFKTRNDRFYIDGDQVRFEGLPMTCRYTGDVDTINLNHDFGYFKSDKIKYIQPSISIDNLGNYWVSFSIEEPIIELNIPQSESIGIDMGIRQTMVLSTGEVFNRPKDKINKLDRRLRRVQRHRTRDINRRLEEAHRTKTKYEDIPVSKRARKREDRVRKLYKRITNVKRAFYHETIKQIVTRNPEAIVIETIETRKLQYQRKGHKNNHELAHADFYTMRKIFEGKCNKYGVRLIEADPEYPSSQICSNCGYRQDIGSKKTYVCPQCGMRLDRDLNAALNLRSLAM